MELLRERSREPSDDVVSFVDALAFSWLTAGTDAHAKNYSILIGAEGRVRLAPLYDLASALPYAGNQLQKLKLAMSIGGRYRVRDIGAHRWEKLASELKLSRGEVRARIQRLADSLPDLASGLLRRTKSEGLSHRVLTTLVDALARRSAECAEAMTDYSGR